MTADSTPDGLLGRVEGTLALVAAGHGETYDRDCQMYFGCSCGWDNDSDEHNNGYEQHLAAMQVAALVDDYGLAEEWGVYEVDQSTMDRRKRHMAHVPPERRADLSILLDRDPVHRHEEHRLLTDWHSATSSETTEESHD